MKTKKPRVSAPSSAVEVSGDAGERKPDFLWSGRPVFRCKHEGCTYERLENLADVLEHEKGHQPPARESRILGADGEPLLTTSEHGDQK